ncbi:hypothetical protein B0G83_13020 [Paraburkholderia sp. BL21I4N1]|nr:hypothetical protein B0G83_13020 [Paraburkholderia sp. BL21I4N1]
MSTRKVSCPRSQFPKFFHHSPRRREERPSESICVALFAGIIVHVILVDLRSPASCYEVSQFMSARLRLAVSPMVCINQNACSECIVVSK